MSEYIKANPLDEKIILYNYNVELNLMREKYKKASDELNKYKNRCKEINFISEVGKKIVSSLDIEETLRIISTEIKQIINFDIIEIALFDEKLKILKYNIYYDYEKNIYTGEISTNNNELFEVCCFNRKQDLVKSCMDSEFYNNTFSFIHKKDRKNINSIICIPLSVNNKVIGIFNIQSYNEASYNLNSVEKIKLLTSYISISSANSILFNNTRYSAEHDSLTNILNRKEILDKGLKCCKSLIKEEDKCSVIMFDIDYFKKVNDIYGHNIGDIILKNISRIAKTRIRRSDFIGRYGGEEFLIVLPQISLEDTMYVAERLRKSIESYKYRIENKKYINVTISLGVYEFNYNDKNFSEGLKKVDMALYEAKNSGRNRCMKYT